MAARPIEMILVCDTDGELRPLCFCYEDDTHYRHTISILDVVVAKGISYAGLPLYMQSVNRREGIPGGAVVCG